MQTRKKLRLMARRLKQRHKRPRSPGVTKKDKISLDRDHNV